MQLQSCLLIPISSEELLSDEKRAQLQIGSTTREEVYGLFGEPDFGNADESSVLYSRVRREWLIILSPGQPEPGAGEVEENLYVEFDDQNALRHFELVDFVERKACASNGICMMRPGMGRNTYFVVFTRSPSDDREAKQFHQLPDHCSVYFFGDVAMENQDFVTAWHTVCLDQQSVVSTLYSPDLYLRWNLPPGTHRLRVQNAWAWDWRLGEGSTGFLAMINRGKDEWMTLTHTVECISGEAHFLGVEESVRWEAAKKEDKSGWLFANRIAGIKFRLDRVSSETGQAKIKERRLTADTTKLSSTSDADTLSFQEIFSSCDIWNQKINE